ncbi:MAG: glycosyltransferase family 39 protein [Phycisphaerales bacterium]|nr:glycosyltransferase family 39 protein [Phycisphaerales bacterium]
MDRTYNPTMPDVLLVSGKRLGRDWIAVMFLAGIYAAVAWFSVQHVNPLWDEVSDYHATLGLLEHPLTGSGLDGSQARLPLYVTAAVFAFTGPSLAVARVLSIVFCSTAIILTYVAGRAWFSRSAALLATAILVFSPYYLGFGRYAFTEGDAFCPLPVLLLLLAFISYLRHRDTLRLLVLSATLALAVSVKFYHLFFIPPLILCDYIELRSLSDKDKLPGAPHRLYFWASSAFVLEILAMLMTQIGLSQAALVCWGLGLLVLLIGSVTVLRGAQAWQEKGDGPYWITPAAWLVILPAAGAACLALFPEHVLHPEMPRAMYRHVFHRIHALPMTPFIDPVRLYLGILLTKVGPPLGITTLAALAWAWWRAPREPISRVLTAVVILYILLLTTQPLRQTFNLMSIYPVLILLTAAFIVWVYHYLRFHRLAQSAWLAWSATAAVLLFWGVLSVYPEFGYYGYTIVGNRWMGAESRGYRNLIQVTNDGTLDALEWCATQVPAGRRVVSYLWDERVIDDYVDAHPPNYELVRRHAWESRDHGPSIDDADYLLLSMNNEVTYDDLPPTEDFLRWFDPRPVHVVGRGRGPYRMAVVMIYQRRLPEELSGPVPTIAEEYDE